MCCHFGVTGFQRSTLLYTQSGSGWLGVYSFNILAASWLQQLHVAVRLVMAEHRLLSLLWGVHGCPGILNIDLSPSRLPAR